MIDLFDSPDVATGSSPFGEGLVGADAVAEHLSIDRATVYKLAAAGDLPCVAIGRARRFRVEDVKRFVEGRLRKAARPDKVQVLLAARPPWRRSNDLDASRGQSVHRKQESPADSTRPRQEAVP